MLFQLFRLYKMEWEWKLIMRIKEVRIPKETVVDYFTL
jgi:hypothetical protein